MAHYRDRFVEKRLEMVLKFSPIVGLFGHRQVGKTSLAERFAGEYVTFDDRRKIDEASDDPSAFLRRMTKFPAVIDECQLVPALFPALKEQVRITKRPGQFLLTGSVRFSSRKAIRESLTGRIVGVELPPLGVAEILDLPKSKVLSAMMQGDERKITEAFRRAFGDQENFRKARNSWQTAGEVGGLPGVCFIRDTRLRQERLESQIQTILERDLRLLQETSLPLPSLRRVLAALAQKTAQPFSYAELQRSTRVSIPTLRRLMLSFQSMFLLSHLETRGDEAHPAYVFVDAGEALYLNEGRIDPLFAETQLLYSQLVAQLADERLDLGKHTIIKWFQFRTRGGSFVPLCFEVGKKIFGFLPTTTGSVSPKDLSSARSLQRQFPDAIVFLTNNASETWEKIGPGIFSIPLALLSL